MASGGSGDVLTGISSFLGQGMNPLDAAIAGVYIHGLAGDMATKSIGEYGLTASDVIGKSEEVIKDLQRTDNMRFWKYSLS